MGMLYTLGHPLGRLGAKSSRGTKSVAIAIREEHSTRPSAARSDGSALHPQYCFKISGSPYSLEDRMPLHETAVMLLRPTKNSVRVDLTL